MTLPNVITRFSQEKITKFIAIYLLVAASCNTADKAPSQEFAKSTIISAYGFPRIETRLFSKGDMVVREYTNMHLPFVEAGYMTFLTTGYGSGLEYTEKSKPFIVKSCNDQHYCKMAMNIGSWSIISIDGIRKIGDTEFEVIFSIALEFNEFGEILNQFPIGQVDETLKSERIKQVTCKLIKFDTGWQIQQSDLDTFTKLLEKNQLRMAILF